MRRIASLAVASLIVVAALAISPNFRQRDGERNPYAGDFLHEWIGGWVVRNGHGSRLYDPSFTIPLQHDAALVGFRLMRDRHIPMVYPPAYYLAVSPLSALPYRMAAWVWVVLGLGCFAAAVVLLDRALDDGLLDGAPALRRVADVATLVALPAAVAFVPFAENLVSGQKGTIWLLLFTASFVALRRGHDVAAGLIFGVLALKPQLALVVPAALLAKGHWRFALGAATSACLLVVASLAMGSDVARAYVDFAMRAADFVRFGPGYVHRLHSAYGFFALMAGGPTMAARVATVIAAAVIVGLLACLLRGPVDPSAPAFLAQYAGLVVATCLLSPHLLTYDLTILLLPMVLASVLVLRGIAPTSSRRALLWVVVALYVACGASPAIAQASHVQLTTPLMLVFLSFLVTVPPEAAHR